MSTLMLRCFNYLQHVRLRPLKRSKVREYGLAINRLLGIEDDSHVSDALYGVYGNALTVEQMDDLLLREGIGVEG